MGFKAFFAEEGWQGMIRWDIDRELLESPAVTNRDLFAEKWKDRPAEEIITQYSGLTPAQARAEFGDIFDRLKKLGIELRGRGLELGAGVAVLSSVAVLDWPGIEEIFAVELVPNVASALQPSAVACIAADRARKIRSVIGSFDRMSVPDAYFDFCIEYASLHHSNDLQGTLREVARVLKPGSPLIAIDRAHPDEVSDEQLQFMLAVEYSMRWKRRNGYSDERLTRAQNGEHEIRRGEWLAAFNAAGFDVMQTFELRAVGLREFFYKVLLMVPFRLRKALRLYPSRVGPTGREMLWRIGMLLGGHGDPIYQVGAREHTVFIAVRRR